MTIRAELLRRIEAVPESIEIQADEYLYTLAAVLAEAQILEEVLTYYRLHEANSFQLVEGPSSQQLLRKQKALSALVKSLTQRLEEFGVDADVHHTLLEFTQASADQIRLWLEGGWPWETVKTEWGLYRISHPDAGLSHRVFKSLVLMGAMITPPKVFYRIQRAFTHNSLYRRARKRWLPVPEMRHIHRERRAGS